MTKKVPQVAKPRTPLFAGIADKVWQEVLACAAYRVVSSGAFLFHQGEPSTAFYLLQQGRVKVTQVTPEGHEVIVAILGPGDIVGGIAVIADIPYPASAQAVETCRLWCWDRETFWRLLERYPALALNALRVLAGRFQELQDRYRELATERVERRVARALLRLAGQMGRREADRVVIDYPLTRQDLAELTGTTLYTVSRILRRWEEQGLVEVGRERVHILSPHGLVSIAEDEPFPQ